jgi:stress-induced morphogen
MPSCEEIKRRIETAIPGARAEVEDYTGGGDHFRATVTAPAFAGRSRIEQHRLVYDVFGAEIGGPIHALSLRTQPPQEGEQLPGEDTAGAGLYGAAAPGATTR